MAGTCRPSQNRLFMADNLPTTPRLVRDLMKVGVPTCPADTPVIDLARLFIEKDIEAVVVLNPDDGHGLGFVGREELVKAYIRDDAASLKAEDIMHEGVPDAPPDIPLEAAAQIMLDLGIRSLFMMHHAGGIIYPAGVLTYAHLIRHLAARSDEDLRDLGIKAQRQLPLETFIQRREAARKRSGGK